MGIAWDETSRGFTIGRFRDTYEQNCSIQASSLATEQAIWFGAEDVRVRIGNPWGNHAPALSSGKGQRWN